MTLAVSPDGGICPLDAGSLDEHCLELQRQEEQIGQVGHRE